MTGVSAPAPPRKRLLRRAGSDYSTRLRRCFQLAFLVLNVWIGVEFYWFVRYYETGGRGAWASRPPGVEGWLPMASLMNLKVFLATGEIPRLHPAGMFLLISFLGRHVPRQALCGCQRRAAASEPSRVYLDLIPGALTEPRP